MERCNVTLKDELAKHIGKTVYIGARSSFFFIGPAEEALSSMAFLVLMMRRIALMTSKKVSSRRLKLAMDNGEKLAQRLVKQVYDHDMCGGGTCIIIDGKEFGMFWTREEYLVQKKALMSALNNFQT